MNILDNIKNLLDNDYVKGFIVIFVILYAGIIAPPLPNIIKKIFDNVLGKIVILSLIAYYVSDFYDKNNRISIGIAILLTILYLFLSNVSLTENIIEKFSNTIDSNNLIGGTLESEQEEELNETELEENFEKITKEVAEEIESEIDSEENKKTWEYKEFDNEVLDKQHKLKSAYKQAKKDLNVYQEQYQQAEDKYENILEKIKKHDTNQDGILDSNDIIQEESQEEQEDNTMTGGSGNLEGYETQLNDYKKAFDKLFTVEGNSCVDNNNEINELINDIDSL